MLAARPASRVATKSSGPMTRGYWFQGAEASSVAKGLATVA